MVYFVLALALFHGDSYEEVMRKLVQGLSWLAIWKGNGTCRPPRPSPRPAKGSAASHCGTHAITATETGTAGTGEVPLALALASAPGTLGPGMLVMADRGLYSHQMITAIADAGADSCVRVTATQDLPVLGLAQTSAAHR